MAQEAELRTKIVSGRERRAPFPLSEVLCTENGHWTGDPVEPQVTSMALSGQGSRAGLWEKMWSPEFPPVPLQTIYFPTPSSHYIYISQILAGSIFYPSRSWLWINSVTMKVWSLGFLLISRNFYSWNLPPSLPSLPQNLLQSCTISDTDLVSHPSPKQATLI